MQHKRAIAHFNNLHTAFCYCIATYSNANMQNNNVQKTQVALNVLNNITCMDDDACTFAQVYTNCTSALVLAQTILRKMHKSIAYKCNAQCNALYMQSYIMLQQALLQHSYTV
jgi:hypothetical protein